MKVFVGTVVHSTWEDPLIIMDDMALGVDNGKIKFLSPAAKQLETLMTTQGFTESDVVRLNDGEFLIPGLVDTHIHAPQYVNCGTGLDLPLLEWLDKYTFKAEAMFTDLDFAQEAYTKAVRRVLKNGTTTACYFATIDVEATIKLCNIIGAFGQRALVGKVCMNTNCPPHYSETTTESLQDTKIFVKAVRALKNPLIDPIITPRFAVSCTGELLQGLGELAEQYGAYIQTHLSENLAECEKVSEMFPQSDSYTDVYRMTGLLTSKSVFAHCVHLSDDEMTLIKAAKAGIAHCPNSNISIASGLCDVRRLLDNEIKVGLGTDVSGGYHPSILDAIRQAAQTSNIVSLHKPSDYKHIDYREAFRLATLGGSQVLGMDDRIGNFDVGKDFDALVVSVTCSDSPCDVFDKDSIDDKFQKFIYLGDDRNIIDVFVAGKKVWSRRAACNGS